MDSEVKPWRLNPRPRAAASRRDGNAAGTRRGSAIPSHVESLGTEAWGTLRIPAATTPSPARAHKETDLPAGTKLGARSASAPGDLTIDERAIDFNSEPLQLLPYPSRIRIRFEFEFVSAVFHPRSTKG